MPLIARLRQDENGSLGVEYAFAIPVLVTIMIGILQFGMVLHANGVMRHALGEGIRLAKVDWDATDAEITQATKDALVGIDPKGVKSVTFTKGDDNGATYGRVTMQYEMTPVIPLAPIPTIKLEETRQSWLPT